jgi:DNA-binding GntR family transcriptional regulator
VDNAFVPNHAPPTLGLTRSAAVANELRRQIRSGELPAGTRLRQVEVAERFGVSTTPVREAFTTLASEGLVKQDTHRGAVVFVPSREDLLHNYEIRMALEPLATRLAATNVTPEEIETLTALLAEMRAALIDDTARYGLVLNPRFHATIYAAARRPRLAELIEQMRDASAAYIQLLALQPQPIEYLEGAQAEHEEIVDALRARAPKKAADAMARHLKHSLDQMFAALDHDAVT